MNSQCRSKEKKVLHSHTGAVTQSEAWRSAEPPPITGTEIPSLDGVATEVRCSHTKMIVFPTLLTLYFTLQPEQQF